MYQVSFGIVHNSKFYDGDSDDDDGMESSTTNTSLVGKKSKSHLTLRKGT